VALDKNGLDGLLVTSMYNRRYITGFTGTAGVALISKNDARFITDFRYTEQAESQVKEFKVIEHKGTIHEEIKKQLKEMNIKRLAFEKDHTTYGEYEVYNNLFEVELVPVSGLIEELRLIKSKDELTILKK